MGKKTHVFLLLNYSMILETEWSESVSRKMAVASSFRPVAESKDIEYDCEYNFVLLVMHLSDCSFELA